MAYLMEKYRSEILISTFFIWLGTYRALGLYLTGRDILYKKNNDEEIKWR